MRKPKKSATVVYDDRHPDGAQRPTDGGRLVGLALQLEVEPRHVVDRRVDGDAERDRGDQARADVQEDPEPRPSRRRRSGSAARSAGSPGTRSASRGTSPTCTTKMTPSAIARLSICPRDDVGRGARQEHEGAGEAHGQVGREPLRDVVADLRQRLLDGARPREAWSAPGCSPWRSPASPRCGRSTGWCRPSSAPGRGSPVSPRTAWARCGGHDLALLVDDRGRRRRPG